MTLRSNDQNGPEKMRVLRLSHSSLTPALRQRERALARRYPELELQVITPFHWREAEVDVEAKPDDLFPVRRAHTYLSRHIQLFAYDPRPIIRALREHRPHVVDISHEPYSVACAQTLTLCGWFAPQAAIVMHTNQNILHNYPPPFNWLEQRAFRRVAAAYACSETVREVLRAKGFNKLAPVITYGVDTEAFRPPAVARKRSDKGIRIGFVGRMLSGKGLNVLAEALERLRAERWQLLIVGDGPERPEFERRLAAAGLHQRAQFTGAVDYHLVPEYFHQMDVLVMPTQTTGRIREQFGRVLVEAMASGVPAIGSSCGAIPEVIGNAGIVFPEGDAEALANALQTVLADDGLRARLAQSGIERVEQYYSWDRVAEQTYKLFTRVLQARQETVRDSSFELAT